MADILLIDDDPALRGTLRKVMERKGHVVREAEDGERGLREAGASLPDLVITDLLMPEKEGIETIMELQDRWPELPIIAISGAGGEAGGPLEDAALFGARAVLSKPFSLDEFLATVDRVLAGGKASGD
ncbi:MAG: response regulator [Gemmatimonadales bacterium]|nr:MAG: response regulator [Gemmatimonadales bacterium]